MAISNISIEDIRILVDVDYTTGKIFWRPRQLCFFKGETEAIMQGNMNRWNSVYAHSEAFRQVGHGGYLRGGILGEQGMAHWVVWAHYTGSWPKFQIDHINRVVTDNRIDNLRVCTGRENQGNTAGKPYASSQFKGVCFHVSNKKFMASIRSSGKRIHLGYFESEINAAMAYDEAAKKVFGDFAYLNFPDRR